MKILFTGGGTGGHVFPIIAIAREIRRIYRGKDLQLFHIGPEDEFSSIVLSQEGIKVKIISAGKIRRYLGWKSALQNLVDLFIKVPIGVIRAFFYVFFLAPDLVFSKGGFGSMPGVIAAWLLQVPIFLHESDFIPGLANQLLNKFSLVVFVSFPETKYFKASKTVIIGNPIRRELLDASRGEAEEFFKLSKEKPVILIVGGSQGAQRINDKILEALPNLLKNFEVIHQTGTKNFKQVKAEAKVVMPENLERYYHVFPFFKEEELKKAYKVADLIISRAGSGSIFEIAAVGKPSILVPLPEAAQNHQIRNAYSYARTGASQVLEESNFTAYFFLGKLQFLFSSPESLENMVKAAKKFSKPEAAKIIAKYIVDSLR